MAAHPRLDATTSPGVGFAFPAKKVTWTKRDVLLFNLSIGCGADEQKYVYELDRGFSAFPTFPLGLVFKLDHTEVIDFYASQKSTRIPGVPKLDPKALVDGDRTIQCLKPLPVTSECRNFEFRSKVLGVYDKGRAGTMVRSEDVLVDAASGEAYTRIVGSLFYVGQGNWGGPKGPRAATYPPPTDKAASMTFNFRISETSAHLYRLNGDYNPLHAVPEVGKKMGFGGIIVHGVYPFNYIAHEIAKRFGKGDQASIREVSARFKSVVKPGDIIQVDCWRMGGPKHWLDELEGIRWTATNTAKGGEQCLSDGRALVDSSRGSLDSKM